MNCLLFNFTSSDSEDLKEHSIDFRKVNCDNHFFISLFKEQSNDFRPRNCLSCNEFLLNQWFKVNHAFLLHYGAGGNAFDEKPVNYTNLGEVQKYEITFAQYLQNHDFYNSEKLADDFLLNIKIKTRRSAEGNLIIQCGFSLEKMQLSPFENEALILNSRYWSTEGYQTKSFNYNIYFNLKEWIRKRVINNGIAGSLLHFNQFLYVNVKILDSVSQFFCEMADFINFKGVQDDVDDNAIMEVDKCEPAETVSDNEFIDDETHINESIEDYYAFANVSRNVEDKMQDSFLESDNSKSHHEVNNYCDDNYNPDSEKID